MMSSSRLLHISSGYFRTPWLMSSRTRSRFSRCPCFTRILSHTAAIDFLLTPVSLVITWSMSAMASAMWSRNVLCNCWNEARRRMSTNRSSNLSLLPSRMSSSISRSSQMLCAMGTTFRKNPSGHAMRQYLGSLFASSASWAAVEMIVMMFAVLRSMNVTPTPTVFLLAWGFTARPLFNSCGADAFCDTAKSNFTGTTPTSVEPSSFLSLGMTLKPAAM
mmetsp:Transcript_111639/g.315277  ORF Transcript_111639/g.315277 Transcript_111639/m.315277 type:complete len:219 (-) Transcript_111639:9-665(-)